MTGLSKALLREGARFIIAKMTMQKPQVRRATNEDLETLVALWQTEGLPATELAKRFKEFQVIEHNGLIHAAIGLQIAGMEGALHSECYALPEEADTCRGLFWERLQVVAQNHGIVRLWTQFATPFWNHSGFQFAVGDVVQKLPPVFNAGPGPWRVIQLRDEPPSVAAIDKEFALFKELERERTGRLLRSAKVMKMIAAIFVLGVFVLLAFWIVAWYKTQNRPH